MALNKYMHPRNPYRRPPDFKELAINYPEFRKFVKQDLSGKVQVDFKDKGAVRELTKSLLDKDFKLTVEIPPDRLVPTVPLRMNYLLWIEDVLTTAGGMKSGIGIDIGTGASCIYPLLAARHFNWKMLATEINNESIECANRNVTANNLQEFITVKKVEEDKMLNGVVEEGVEYDFCMCNPPFFENESELSMSNKSRNADRNPPRNSHTGSNFELVTPGGEVSFIRRIIKDSKILNTKIRLYTVMVGHRRNVKEIMINLKRYGPSRLYKGKLCQGRTMRWAVGWSFCKDMPSMPSKKDPGDWGRRWLYPHKHTLDVVKDRVVKLLTDIKIDTVVDEDKDAELVTVLLTAYENTWTHIRKKLRADKRRVREFAVSSSTDILMDEKPEENIGSGSTANESDSKPLVSSSSDIVSGLEEATQESSGNSSQGNSAVQSAHEGSSKRPAEEPPLSNPKRLRESKDILLEAHIILFVMDEKIFFTINFVRGTGGKLECNQLFQMLINKLNLIR